MEIIHVPRAIMQQRGWLPPEPDNTQAILDVADLVSQYRFGCVSALLSMEQRELLVETLTALWADLSDLGRES